MASSAAKTVNAYLKELPADRRRVVSAVRKRILEHLPAGYEEGMNFGAITYHIPLKRFPDTYNGQPLCYVALAAQKNFFTLYLMGPYGSPKLRKQLEEAFHKAGKKMDMGKSCLHFRDLNDLPLDAIDEIVASVPAEKWIEVYEMSRRARGKRAKKPT
jgi:hypothetical protein